MDFELGKTYDELEIGMSASFTKTITETDVYLFAGISGDFNPMHTNEEFAKLTSFGTRIAHGALPQCLCAPVLGMKLPGQGTVALEVTTRFKAPVMVGQSYVVRARIVGDERSELDCRAEVIDGDGETCAEASATFVALGPAQAVEAAGGEIPDGTRAFGRG